MLPQDQNTERYNTRDTRHTRVWYFPQHIYKQYFDYVTTSAEYNHWQTTLSLSLSLGARSSLEVNAPGGRGTAILPQYIKAELRLGSVT